MTNFDIIEKLNNAYGATTAACNMFADAINSISWESVFNADGETYFCIGNLTLTVENINPFKEAYKPSILVLGASPFSIELGLNPIITKY